MKRGIFFALVILLGVRVVHADELFSGDKESYFVYTIQLPGNGGEGYRFETQLLKNQTGRYELILWDWSEGVQRITCDLADRSGNPWAVCLVPKNFGMNFLRLTFNTASDPSVSVNQSPNFTDTEFVAKAKPELQECPDGKVLSADNTQCVDPQTCPEGKILSADRRVCVDPPLCDEGKVLNVDSTECIDPPICTGNQTLNSDGNQCLDAALPENGGDAGTIDPGFGVKEPGSSADKKSWFCSLNKNAEMDSMTFLWLVLPLLFAKLRNKTSV
ncbi:MAG: hypothetical protein Q7R40_17940 [Phaeospirillum sp.]|nr:hypothetical protein [Phaeospirillum sp.]